MSSMDLKLQFWIKNNYNVIFRGKHGVGKTSMIIDAFNEAKIKWMYFSAATMDPWVDFIGVPKERVGKNGKSYLDLVRPEAFEEDQVEALMFDEYNRAHKKVRNAVMELIQFKSINGRKFNNLKIVWAAINPSEEDEEENDLRYDVEPLDPAQLDRFHVVVDIPYKPSSEYFIRTYGKETGKVALTWWNKLPDNIKNQVSPRRLDYAIDMYLKAGDMRDVLPKSANISKLLTELKLGPVQDIITTLIKNNDKEKAKEFITNENNFCSAIDIICSTSKNMEFFIPLLTDEKIVAIITGKSMYKQKIKQFVFEHLKIYKTLLQNILDSNTYKKLCKEINTAFHYAETLGAEYGTTMNKQANRHFFSSSTETSFASAIYESKIALSGSHNTYDREKVFRKIYKYMPNKIIDNRHVEDAIKIIRTIIESSHNLTLQNVVYKNSIIHCLNNLFFNWIENVPDYNFAKYYAANKLTKAEKFVYYIDQHADRFLFNVAAQQEKRKPAMGVEWSF